MRAYLASVAVAAASLLAACGGGGSSPTPLPSPTISAAPAGNHIVFAVVGKGQSTGSSATAAVRRMIAASSAVVQEPVEVASQVCTTQTLACLGSFVQGSGIQNATITPQVVDASGSPAPEANAPTVSVADTTAATVAITPPKIDIVAALTPKQTALNVTYPDATGTLPVYIYKNFAIEYNAAGVYDPYASQGYAADSSGGLTASSTGDVYLDSSGNVRTPNGAVFISAATPISTVLDCTTSFTGTSFTSIALNTITANSGADGILLAKSSTPGVCIKVRWGSISVQSAFQSFVGLGLVSNSSGAFSY